MNPAGPIAMSDAKPNKISGPPEKAGRAARDSVPLSADNDKAPDAGESALERSLDDTAAEPEEPAETESDPGDEAEKDELRRSALLDRPNTAVVDVPYHLGEATSN